MRGWCETERERAKWSRSRSLVVARSLVVRRSSFVVRRSPLAAHKNEQRHTQM
jgi:hypothetical protein